MKDVFRFTIYFAINDTYQHRYVVAESEEEATAKIEAYRMDMVNQGFAFFRIIPHPIVEIENVIC